MSTALFILPRVWACEAGPELVLPGPQLVEPAVIQPPAPPIPLRLAFYRKYTEGMLRQYMRFSLEAGRVPSMLGREMFRGKVTSYRVHSFEDVVIFVHDVEKCLARLDHVQQLLILRIAVQEYTKEEAAELLHLPINTLIRRYNKAVDTLTAIFLEVKLLEPQKVVKGVSKAKSAQVVQIKGDKT